MALYKLTPEYTNAEGKTVPCQTVIRTVDGVQTFIPFDTANTSYQEYLEWVAAGNTPEAAD